MSAALWSGSFGDAYTDRNRVEWEKRIPFWRDVMGKTRALRAFEVGCGSGWNMRAIKSIAPKCWVRGIDVNKDAIYEAMAAGLDVYRMAASNMSRLAAFDLVFTAGCLIHIPPADLEAVMRAIIAASQEYVLAIEYEADVETTVEYRGHKDALWKRPYGGIYRDYGLQIFKYWPNIGREQGFDDCAAWLLRKPKSD